MLKNKKIILITSLVILLLAGGAFAYSRLNDNQYPQNPSGEYITEEADKPNGNDQSTNQPSITSDENTEPPKPPKTANNPSPGSTLSKPTGNFVSSHQVNSSSTIESVCVTTPSAQCKIVLTMGATIKSLVAKTTDSEGTTAWIWQPKKIGITSGSWQIKAVATLGGQTKESKDAMPLGVTP
jgi:hypothetical protein